MSGGCGDQIGPLSANETVFIVSRAVKGAGAPFGLGEDIAGGVVWLARRGEPAAAALADALERFAAAKSSAALAFETGAEGGQLVTTDGKPASALFAGSAAADWLQIGCGRRALDVSQVDQPLLAAAVAAAILQRLGGLLQFHGHDRITYDGADRRSAATDDHAIMMDRPAWQVVQSFFAQALVPATTESRTHGAGAGLVDRD